MSKRGDANIWWIIIGAVIALVVLVVLMLIFTQKTTSLGGGLSDCEGKGGVCAPAGISCPASTLKTTAFTCSGGKECCVGSPQECGLGKAECPDGPQNCFPYGQKSYCQ